MTTTAIKNTTIQTIIDATAPLQRLEELASGDPAYMEGLANLLIDQGKPVTWMTLGELLSICGEYHKQFHAAPLAVQP